MTIEKVSFQINVLFAQFKDKVFLMKEENGKDLEIKKFQFIQKVIKLLDAKTLD